MKKKKIILVGGARPNFMKISPILKEMKKAKNDFVPILVHTGQHYDSKMSKVFFDVLGLGKPDVYLGVGSGSHANQTAKIMMLFEKYCLESKPDMIMVVGDVNSTMASAIVSAKLNIPLIHIESGLRSYDRTMPEEVNRIITDNLSDYLFTTSVDANSNLKKEGIPSNRIHFVGNVMIDSLKSFIGKAKSRKTYEKYDLLKKRYMLVTLHRPSNVDNPDFLVQITEALIALSKELPVVFPVHPRTKNKIIEAGLERKYSQANIKLLEPLGYLDFLNLMNFAKLILTDSGGIQEETTVLKIPCLTFRNNTERPITITKGTNTLIGTNPEKIYKPFKRVLRGTYKKGGIPKYWDGKAAKRIIKILKEITL